MTSNEKRIPRNYNWSHHGGQGAHYWGRHHWDRVAEILYRLFLQLINLPLRGPEVSQTNCLSPEIFNLIGGS